MRAGAAAADCTSKSVCRLRVCAAAGLLPPRAPAVRSAPSERHARRGAGRALASRTPRDGPGLPGVAPPARASHGARDLAVRADQPCAHVLVAPARAAAAAWPPESWPEPAVLICLGEVVKLRRRQRGIRGRRRRRRRRRRGHFQLLEWPHGLVQRIRRQRRLACRRRAIRRARLHQRCHRAAVAVHPAVCSTGAAAAARRPAGRALAFAARGLGRSGCGRFAEANAIAGGQQLIRRRRFEQSGCCELRLRRWRR